MSLYNYYIAGGGVRDVSSVCATSVAGNVDKKNKRIQNSIKRTTKKIYYKCHKFPTLLFFINMEKIMGMILFNSLKEKTCKQSYDSLDIIYKNGGIVPKGNTIGGADMVLLGWKYIQKTDDFGEYTHLGRSATLTNEFSPELINEMGANWTSMISKILQSKFSWWMNELEALHPKIIPDI